MKKVLEFSLKLISQLILLRYRPRIVGVTGSVGKTGSKEAIYCVLKEKYRVRRNFGNLNNELGAPLTIIGEKSPGGRNFFIWLKIFIKGILSIIYQPGYPKILVLEMGVDKPNDMRYLTSFIKPQVGVFTAVGEFPVHLEFFPEKGKLVEEKALLLKALPKDGLAVLNYDDLSVRILGDQTEGRVETRYYGFGQGANLQIDNYEIRINDFAKGDFGSVFKLYAEGSVIPVRLNKILGRQHAYAAAAAAMVGLYFGINLVEISKGLTDYRPLAGRTNLIPGVKQTIIIDDTYNSSPMAALASLELMDDIFNQLNQQGIKARKIAVLGDMLELGKETETAHRKVGREAAKRCDLFFVVGERMVFAADEAAKLISQDKIFKFARSQQAGLPLQKQIIKNDIILVKGSRSMAMEKIVEEIKKVV